MLTTNGTVQANMLFSDDLITIITCSVRLYFRLGINFIFLSFSLYLSHSAFLSILDSLSLSLLSTLFLFISFFVFLSFSLPPSMFFSKVPGSYSAKVFIPNCHKSFIIYFSLWYIFLEDGCSNENAVKR